MKQSWILLILLVFTASRGTGSNPASNAVATIAPIATLVISPTAVGTIQTTTTPPSATLPAHAMLVGDYIRQGLAENKIKLLDMQSKLAAKELSIFVEPMDKTHTPEVAATLALGVMVEAISLADASARPTVVRVLYLTPQQKMRRITMTEPALSQFITGAITDAEAMTMVKIEEEQ